MTKCWHLLALLALVTPHADAQPARADAAPFLNINPSWSPDGMRLAFESRRHGNTEIYVINADGSGERRLTTVGAGFENTHPSWSPDGRTIVFDSNRDTAWHVYAIDADGRNERRLTSASAATGNFARHPEWSPDGRLIAFDSDRDGNGELYVIRPDGTGLRRVTDSRANDSHPMWTPRGELVVVRGEGDNRSLAGVHPERDGSRPIFEGGPFYSSVNLSPDGRHFVYRSNAEATPRLFVAPMDGSWAPRPITPPGRTSYEAAWSRDGSRVAFYHDATGVHELYVVDSDGSGARQVTGLAQTRVP